MEAECRYCLHLAPYPGSKAWVKDASGMPTWRCPFARFDRQTPGGRPIKCWFAWDGIWEPNRDVAKAQADCKRFEVHPEAGKFTEKVRAL